MSSRASQIYLYVIASASSPPYKTEKLTFHQWQDCGVVLNAQIPRVDLLVRNRSLTWTSQALSRRKILKADGCVHRSAAVISTSKTSKTCSSKSRTRNYVSSRSVGVRIETPLRLDSTCSPPHLTL